MSDTFTLPAWERVGAAGDFGPGLVMSVGGAPLWWASPDAALRASPEAAVCLLAPWCALEGRTLKMSVPAPGKDFLRNAQEATTLMGGWWGHDPIRYEHAKDRLGVPAGRGPAPATSALFFSGGIDSFYSLVQNPGVGLLVYLVGFDVRLQNRAVWQAITRAHREVALERGLRFVALATNLRDHPVLGQMRWGRYHGVLLAAAAHLLGAEATHWLVSSSFQRENLMPWGSHPDLDPLWSGSGLEITHYGAELWPDEKLAALRDIALVHRRLRVCYADPRAEGNCGRCEKCVRTRLIYWLKLPGVECELMPANPPLAAALDAVPRVELRLILRIYRRLLDHAPPGDPVTNAMRALISRSEGHGGSPPL